MQPASPSVPIIDIRPLVNHSEGQSMVASQIQRACREVGFFYIVGHGVPIQLQDDLERLSQQFFNLSDETKMKISMDKGGKAWRGFFPVGNELTSGKPDLKEGIYFGEEIEPNDTRVQAGLPLHGPNLFPNEIPDFNGIVLQYLDAITQLGHTLMRGISLSLGLEADYFHQKFTEDPLILFRIFHYPPNEINKTEPANWGVGEHTDYGLLTILKQDIIGGLQVKTSNGWMDAPPIENSFVCNIGDMLDRITRGFYRSTPHRVINTSGKSRYSYPFFFDPNFNANIASVDLSQTDVSIQDDEERWDKANIHTFEGTYGEYLTAKVSKVFPALKQNVIS